jgi:hypothetical protein
VVVASVGVVADDGGVGVCRSCLCQIQYKNWNKVDEDDMW